MMEDQKIIGLYWKRDQEAITATSAKYGRLCYRIAWNILSNREDSEESVSDTWLTAWNRIPPHRPSILSSFLAKLTRNISINRWRADHAQKRGGGQMLLALEELEDCADGRESVEQLCESKELIQSYNRFLDSLPEIDRAIFLRRYFFLDPISEIAERTGFSQSKVTSLLHRTRLKLKRHLEQEGYQ